MSSMDETMEAGGYVSAAKAALATSRAVSTIHRQVEREELASTRAGRELYVSVQSLLDLYDGNDIITARIRELGVEPKP